MNKHLKNIYTLISRNKLFLLFFTSILILRLWKVPEFFSFNFDEEYQGSLAWEQVKNFHPIWIGVSASNIEYYLGPGFVYLNAILFKISNGDPISLAWFSTILGLSTSLSIFYIVKNMFNKKAALIAMTIYGASSFLIYFDRRFWNPTPIPFISVWLIYSLFKGHVNPRWYILTAILYATFYHVHLSLMLLVPLILTVLFFDRKKIQIKNWALMIISYFVITLPLLVFDIVHNFDNILGPIKYFFYKNSTAGSLTIVSIRSHFLTFLNAVGKIWFMKLYTSIQDEHCISSHCDISQAAWPLVIFSILLLVLFIRTAINKKGREYYILLGEVTIFPVVFTFYTGYSAEYFLLAWYPICCIAFGIGLSNFPSKLWIVILAIFIFGNSLVMFTTQQEKYGLLVRKKLIKNIMPYISDAPFELETYGTDPRLYHSYGGWRFLFKIYGKTPVRSFADPSFGWIYPDEISDKTPEYTIVVTDGTKLKTKKNPIKSFKEGNYYGYVYNN